LAVVRELLWPLKCCKKKFGLHVKDLIKECHQFRGTLWFNERKK